MKKQKIRKNCKGFTLAEALLASVLLSIAAAGSVLPFTSGAAVQAEGIHLTVAAALADNLMQRITSDKFDDIIANYDGYQEAAGQIKDAAGVVIDDQGYMNFSRSSICQAVYLSQESGNANEIFILAEVTVKYGDRELLTVKKLVAK